MDGRGVTLPIWGGVECTVARVNDRYIDQTQLTGHHDRQDDIARIASLGIKALRYPVIWERVHAGGEADWDWTDERLEAIGSHGIEPIVTLLHHGSGPPHTNLLDAQFPQKFAAYARSVAERYPWIESYTPVNEPLTTARFSALYGVWYPHAADSRAFLTALHNEILATSLAMRAIREVNPRAKLVQTEDLGHVRATPPLQYQAEFENERRFASLDLLCGRVQKRSPFFRWASLNGLDLSDDALQALYCPPDLIGLNYYVTGERFLDHRITAYPGVPAGGNGREPYVDVEAVRVAPEGLLGLCQLGMHVWERYRRPIAVTEAHLGDGDDERVRWVDEQYREACDLAARGADVRGFTVWSLFGACDWDSLLTQQRGRYEPGTFGLKDGAVVETPVAEWIRARAHGVAMQHSSLNEPGWWRQPARLLYNPESESQLGENLPSAS